RAAEPVAIEWGASCIVFSHDRFVTRRGDESERFARGLGRQMTAAMEQPLWEPLRDEEYPHPGRPVPFEPGFSPRLLRRPGSGDEKSLHALCATSGRTISADEELPRLPNGPGFHRMAG